MSDACPLHKRLFYCNTCGRHTANETGSRCLMCETMAALILSYSKTQQGLEFLRQLLPTIDDWVDGHPDAWDYMAVLREHNVTIEACYESLHDPGNEITSAMIFTGYHMGWHHGTIGIGTANQVIACKAAALFVCLWLRGFSASFADKIIDGFVCFLERQENTNLYLCGTIQHAPDSRPYVRLHNERLNIAIDSTLLVEALNIQPDEEVIVTFTKRKKMRQGD